LVIPSRICFLFCQINFRVFFIFKIFLFI
jgi:hypothetical protein